MPLFDFASAPQDEDRSGENFDRVNEVDVVFQDRGLPLGFIPLKNHPDLVFPLTGVPRTACLCVYILSIQHQSLGLPFETNYVFTTRLGLGDDLHMTPEDLRAAVAAGVITEAQAARLKALSDDREGRRKAMPAEDEPFEFFRGFSEIFISIGLVILLSGVTALLAAFGGFALLTLVPLASAGIAWWWAGYFTLKRRMTLPSMVLATAYGIGIVIFAFTLFGQGSAVSQNSGIGAFLLATLAMILWYWRFRLPFAAFLTGIFALGLIYSVTVSGSTFYAVLGSSSGYSALFDLGKSPVFATATLLFGLGAFVVGMWFDTRDPHRLGRHSATAFWCHLLAAPALVNTVAVTLLNGSGLGLLAVALVAITVLALVIDRRSFLTAAIVYIAILIAWVMGETTATSWIFVLMILGAFITAIGTWWVQLRAWVMGVLPNFPGKSSLPPYGSTE